MVSKRVYTEIVLDLGSLDIISENSFMYDGEFDECGGGSRGGGSVTNTVDYGYNARMATIAEEQQTWAKDYYNMWQQYYKPYEIAQARSNLELLPLETDTYKSVLESAKNLVPQQTAAAENFLSAASKGVDVNERMALATSDASNAWKDVSAQTARANARMGVNPNSGKFQGVQANLATQQASQLAGARTQARVSAEDENYKRLKDAASYSGVSSLLSGVSSLRS